MAADDSKPDDSKPDQPAEAAKPEPPAAPIVGSTVGSLLPPVTIPEPDTGYTPAGVPTDRKSTRLNSSHIQKSRMPSSA